MPKLDVDISPLERYRPIVPDWQAFADALRRPLPLTMWTNTLKTTPAKVADWLRSSNIQHEPLPWFDGAFRLPPDAAIGPTWPYKAGWMHIQEEVSMIPTQLCDLPPGSRILDLCAAPGSKTAQFGVALENTGTIVANDNNSQRLRVLRNQVDRLGLANVALCNYDAARLPLPAEPFDIALADVPCTCEGTSRKHPRVLQRNPKVPDYLPPLQKAILERAIRCTRPGGTILYSTCTYAPEENEAVVNAVLQNPALDVSLQPLSVGCLTLSPGVTSWKDETYDDALRHTARLWPHENDTGGFFIALLKKAN